MDIFNIVRGENDNAIFASINTTTTSSTTSPTSTTSSTGFNTSGNTLHIMPITPGNNSGPVNYHVPGNNYSDVYGPSGLGGGVSKPSGPLLIFPLPTGPAPITPTSPGGLTYDNPNKGPDATNIFHPAALYFGFGGMSKAQHALTQSGQLTYIDMRDGKTPTMTNIHYPKGVVIPRLKPGQDLISLGLAVNVGGSALLKSDPRYQQYLNSFKPSNPGIIQSSIKVLTPK